MTRAEALDALRKLTPWLRSEGVTRLRVFGSTARDEADARSDLDLLVDFDVMPGFGFFALERALSERLGVRVDLVLEGGLNPIVRDRVLAEAVDAL